jgi:CheY-like chemotaxis protein
MPTIDKTKVLIVDDEHAIANSLAFILDLQGYITRTAYSGEEGIELAHMFRPDILVSDVFMSGMTGLEAAIEAKTRVPSCEILLMSGNIPKVQELQDWLNGGRGFEILAKPIHPLDLLAKLRSLLRSL